MTQSGKRKEEANLEWVIYGGDVWTEARMLRNSHLLQIWGPVFQKEKTTEKVPPRTWGGIKLGLFKQQKERPSGWSIANKEKVEGRSRESQGYVTAQAFHHKRKRQLWPQIQSNETPSYSLSEQNGYPEDGVNFSFCHLEIMQAYNRVLLSKCSGKGLLHNAAQTGPASVSRYSLAFLGCPESVFLHSFSQVANSHSFITSFAPWNLGVPYQQIRRTQLWPWKIVLEVGQTTGSFPSVLQNDHIVPGTADTDYYRRAGSP